MKGNKYNGLFLCIVLAFGVSTYAQTDEWNKKLYSSETKVSEKILVADSLLLFYRESNPDSAIHFSRLLLNLAFMQKDTGSADYALMHLGSLHRKMGNYDSSIFYYNAALESYKIGNFEEGMASVYNNIATVYKTQSRYDLAIEKYQEALEIFKKSENNNARANIYSNFAGLYFKLENFDKAFEYWIIAKEAYLKGDNSYQITFAIRGIAQIHIERGEYELAESELNEALHLDRINNIPTYEVEDLLLLMKLYLRIQNSQRFDETLKAVQPLIETNELPSTKQSYFEVYADFLTRENKFQLAVEVYDSSLVFLNTKDLPEIHLTLLKKRFLAKISNGNYSNAATELKQIYELERDVVIIRRDRTTQEMAATYNLKAKEDLIDLLNEKNKTAQELVERERELKESKEQQISFLWIGIILICVFFVYILITNRKLNLTKKELEKNVEQKDFLFKELNHRVKNNLHIVNSFLGIEMHGRSDEVQEILKICESRIHSLGLMHEMLYQSDIIEQVELKAYCEKLVEFISKTIVNTPIQIKVNSDQKIVVSSNKVVLIGLIVNELLTNAIKYAKDPSRDLEIELNLIVKEDEVTIEVRDNGIGLSDDFNPQKTKSLGMKLAYGLTKQLKGNFSFKNLEVGSSFTVSFEN